MLVFECLEDRILILPKKETELQKTAGGLYDQSQKPVQEGTVYAVGPGRYAIETGVFIETMLRKGDAVLIGREGGLPINVPIEDGTTQEMKLLRETDVLLLISKKESADT